MGCEVPWDPVIMDNDDVEKYSDFTRFREPGYGGGEYAN